MPADVNVGIFCFVAVGAFVRLAYAYVRIGPRFVRLAPFCALNTFQRMY